MCNKGFCHRQSLVTHSTLHTGIKPYQCESCYNSFSCVGNLLKHRKTHAETCGKIPLTTHRVKHPATKLKVQVNTPATIKIKTTKKRKQFLSLQNQDASPNSEQSCDNNGVAVVEDAEEVILDEKYNNEDVLPFESKMFIKEEKWILTTDETTSQLAEKKQDDERDAENTEECWDNDGGHSDVSVSEAKEIFTESERIKYEFTIDKVVDKNNDDAVSEDSTDLFTRKEKQKIEVEKKEQLPKKTRSKRSKVDREKLKQFIKDRNFGN